MINKPTYLITDPSLPFHDLLYRVEVALQQGLWAVQYRNKKASSQLMLQEAQQLNDLCLSYATPFLINDRIDIALAINATGVHLGQDDLPVALARQLLGKQAIIGATAKTVEQAKAAETDGANYLGVGALFKSPTKPEAICITFDTLRAIREATSLTIFGIGGIRKANLTPDMLACIDGIAASSLLLT
jgi:thiamine-phosphate pyrophosphorylase